MSGDLVGGQALIEGVMVRRGATWAAACRRPDGSIVTTVRTTEPSLGPLRRIPLVRGMGALVDSLRIGMEAMRWSREHAGLDDAEEGSMRERVVVPFVVTGVVAVFLFVPLWVASLAGDVVGDGWGHAALEGVARLGLFLAYLAMLSRLKGVQRTLEYHGAEHMVIAAHEHGVPRGVGAARDFSVRHPRCGTDFFLLIFVVAIVVFALVGPLPPVAMAVSRVVLVPVVVGVSYEILRAGGTLHDRWIGRVLAAPGLVLQRFTTREPSDDQIEVALAALGALVPEPSPTR